jgi:hypothetical protein
MDSGEEVSGRLIVAGRNGPVLLELTIEVLHEVTRLVHFLVVRARDFSITLGRMTGFFPAASRGSMTRSSASKALSANKVSACIWGRSASAPSRSWACPAVRKKASGLPRASTMAWIFVLNPPLLRPIAWSSPSFFERRRCADAHARWCCRSWRIHCPHRPPAFRRASSIRRSQREKRV